MSGAQNKWSALHYSDHKKIGKTKILGQDGLHDRHSAMTVCTQEVIYLNNSSMRKGVVKIIMIDKR